MTIAEFVLARVADDEYFWTRDPRLVDRWAAECEAKRRMIEDLDGYCFTNHRGTAPCGECQRVGCRNLRLLALPYADHPDYQPEWRP